LRTRRTNHVAHQLAATSHKSSQTLRIKRTLCGGKRAANAKLYHLATVRDKLARQECGSQTRMQKAGCMEDTAVAPFSPDRDDFRTRLQRESRGNG
jgi:hypothetical protein